MTEPDPYKARLIQLTLTRLVGVTVAGIGMALAAVERLGATAHVVGGIFIIAGLAWLLLAPRALIRRWRQGD